MKELRMRGLSYLLFFLPAAALAAPPQRVAIQYEMSRNGSAMAEVSEILQHDGKNYSVSSEVQGKGIYALMGVLKRSSKGRIDATGLQSAEYRDQRGNRTPVVAKFDWAKRNIVQESDGRSETLEMPAVLHDPLSMAYTYSFVPPSGREIRFSRADGKGFTPFRFVVVGTEKIKTPAGEMPALHLSKERDGPEDKETDIWLASERNFLPVRILVVEKDGTRIDQIVTRMGF
jgi:hypothetical protein